MSLLFGMSATGDVPITNEGRAGELLSLSVTAPAGNAASVVLKSGGSGGTTIATISAVANTSAQFRFAGAEYVAPLHATLTGANGVFTVEVG